MNISVINPITPAWDLMVRILFKPFEIKKWFYLGFCAFLAQCGEEGGSAASNWQQAGGNANINEAGQWVEHNIAMFIFLIIAAFVLILSIGLLITWLSSRGKFMLLDGIVKNRAAVSEPWAEYKTEGNSLFWLRFIVQIITIAGAAITVGIPLLIALSDIQSGTFGDASVIAISVGALLFIPYLIAMFAFDFFLRVFVVPVMYLRRVRAVEGMRIAWHSLCKEHIGSSILLFLMLLILGIGAGTVGCFAICATCFIGALPYLSSVILLPISVFFICYYIMYIKQFGSQWNFFPGLCYTCGYDLQGLEEDQNCPECGNKP